MIIWDLAKMAWLGWLFYLVVSCNDMYLGT